MPGWPANCMDHGMKLCMRSTAMAATRGPTGIWQTGTRQNIGHLADHSIYNIFRTHDKEDLDEDLRLGTLQKEMCPLVASSTLSALIFRSSQGMRRASVHTDGLNVY